MPPLFPCPAHYLLPAHRCCSFGRNVQQPQRASGNRSETVRVLAVEPWHLKCICVSLQSQKRFVAAFLHFSHIICYLIVFFSFFIPCYFVHFFDAMHYFVDLISTVCMFCFCCSSIHLAVVFARVYVVLIAVYLQLLWHSPQSNLSICPQMPCCNNVVNQNKH